MPLAGGVVLQVDQTTSANQSVLRHLRERKTQIWIAISTYVLVAIVKKQLHVDRRLAEILQIFTVSLFEKVDILQLLTEISSQNQSEHLCN